MQAIATIALTGLLSLPVALAACSSGQSSSDTPAAPDKPHKLGTAVETYIFGTLRSGQAAIGGESTGWILEQSGGTPLEVDISAVLADARRLDGMMVSGWGATYEKKGVERGPRLIFKFSRLMRMNDPTPTSPDRR